MRVAIKKIHLTFSSLVCLHLSTLSNALTHTRMCKHTHTCTHTHAHTHTPTYPTTLFFSSSHQYLHLWPFEAKNSLDSRVIWISDVSNVLRQVVNFKQICRLEHFKDVGRYLKAENKSLFLKQLQTTRCTCPTITEMRDLAPVC